MMRYYKNVAFVLIGFYFLSCNSKEKETTHVSSEVNSSSTIMNLNKVLKQHSKSADSLSYASILSKVYSQSSSKKIWLKKESLNSIGVQLDSFIQYSLHYGLFPEDYHYSTLLKNNTELNSGKTNDKKSLSLQSDILYTDAFFKLAHDLKIGRMNKDSITLSADTTIPENFYTDLLKEVDKKENVFAVLESLEPKHKEYIATRKALPDYIKQLNLKKYTYVVYPNKDSAQMVSNLMKRLEEENLATYLAKPDSAFFNALISKTQKLKGVKVTGKPTIELIKKLNENDWYQYKRVAVSLDRYKLLPKEMPSLYVWVNLPSYHLKLVQNDSTVMTSKVIIGKPANRTPELNSSISNIVLYPTWTVPYSIILKEMLPIAKRNPGYFSKRGFKVYRGGKAINPASVNWGKYSKNVPFRFVQDEGGGNALGVIKFNFENPYAVYLHDTNQRYLFERTSRALSHGCVRVNLWDSMARYLINTAGAYYPDYVEVNKDSISPSNDTISISKAKLVDSVTIIGDSLKRYMAKRKNMALLMKKNVPIFIRYITCETLNGKIIFHSDIYNDDKKVIDLYFAKK